MWTISMLKTNAKDFLKRYYWKAVAVSLIVLLLTGGLSSSARSSSSALKAVTGPSITDQLSEIMEEIESDVGYSSSDNSGSSDSSGSTYDFGDYDFNDFDFGYDYSDSSSYGSSSSSSSYSSSTADQFMEGLEGFLGVMLGVIIVIVLIAALVSLAFTVFVRNPILVGENRFYLENRRRPAGIGEAFSSFGSGRYLATVKNMFLLNLEIGLWSLLLIIPGIIKSYEYALVPYILAENPQISSARAKEISSKTMNGEKMNLFLLDFSFIGWAILASIVPFGVIFLRPYISATRAEFYCCMKQKALSYAYSDSFELFEDFDTPVDTFDFNQGYGAGSSQYPEQPYPGYPGSSYPSSQPYQDPTQTVSKPSAPAPKATMEDLTPPPVDGMYEITSLPPLDDLDNKNGL